MHSVPRRHWLARGYYGKVFSRFRLKEGRADYAEIDMIDELTR